MSVGVYGSSSPSLFGERGITIQTRRPYTQNDRRDAFSEVSRADDGCGALDARANAIVLAHLSFLGLTQPKAQALANAQHRIDMATGEQQVSCNEVELFPIIFRSVELAPAPTPKPTQIQRSRCL